jgi:hypothetical protein
MARAPAPNPAARPVMALRRAAGTLMRGISKEMTMAKRRSTPETMSKYQNKSRFFQSMTLPFEEKCE